MTQDSHGSGSSVASASPKRRVSRRGRAAIVVAAVVGASGLAIALAAGPNSGSKPPAAGGKSAATLDVFEAQRMSFDITTTALGEMKAKNQVELRNELDSESTIVEIVPEGKTAKNRMHADFVSDDRAADVERLIGLGASKIGDHDEYGISWTTLADVEGNEFCVADPAPGH